MLIAQIFALKFIAEYKTISSLGTRLSVDNCINPAIKSVSVRISVETYIVQAGYKVRDSIVFCTADLTVSSNDKGGIAPVAISTVDPIALTDFGKFIAANNPLKMVPLESPAAIRVKPGI